MQCFGIGGFRPLGLATTLLLALTTSSMQASEGVILNGEPVAVGNGLARVVVTQDSSGIPISIAVALTGGALEGLPAPQPDQQVWLYLLPLPEGVSPTGYDHVLLDWNPAGHIPDGVYSVPHFDMHFYLISDAERQAVTFLGPDREQQLAPPDASLVPAGYIVPPESAVESMGVHGIDLAGHEFHGQPFTHAFIYGYHAGRLIFLEPMVSLDFLRSRPDVTMPVNTPARYSLSGYYPTQYRVGFDPLSDEYRIELLGLRHFNAEPRTAQH
ncbi:hypothetical protein L861_22840 [Litchfieldella anticariensis FP35 = DSM 16096]|uniref:TTHB210-like domain-containing protein n=1 Tax=Litchfieldella anticariensis (strain DSM 16096 / CECT 5854 / CIP 108499 / LMG 22089 / FP35) TaxID=1121939 RepID=S2KMK2_LITA3|nr:DUF5602 domain-containing protein [Halomonas anticariensis]EPC03150.1 hypothetical protein L861_22840 [Halomonas anticariensis FP35 = DSM 16096]